MELFWTCRDRLGGAWSAAGVAVLDREVVPEGMPFVLDDDGSYDLRLNAFLRSLPTLGARAPSSWTAYARDIVTWARFLSEVRGTTIWEATPADFDAFYRARRLGDPPAIGPATWDRSVAALTRLYGWSVRRGHVAAMPLATVTKPVRKTDGQWEIREVPAAREGRGDDETVRSVSLSRYRQFRDVGMRGLLPDGRRDRRFRGTNVERNVAFADLLLTTGMRVGEATATTAWELPRLLPAPTARTSFDLSAAVVKNRRGRPVFVSRRALRAVHDYVTFDRVDTVHRARSAGRYATGSWQPVAARRRGLRVDGRPVRWDLVGEDLRSRALVGNAPGSVEPLALWLTRDGRPMSTAAWHEVFATANARCERLGLDVHVTPHMLRHTFAVETLSALVRVHLRRAVSDPTPAQRSQQAYAWMLGDPIRRVQKLLGHRSESSTRRYLGSVQQVQDLVDEALHDWERSVAEPVMADSALDDE